VFWLSILTLNIFGSRNGQKVPFLKALLFTQPTVKWVPCAVTGRALRLVCETDHSPSSNAEIKYDCSYISNPMHIVGDSRAMLSHIKAFNSVRVENCAFCYTSASHISSSATWGRAIPADKTAQQCSNLILILVESLSPLVGVQGKPPKTNTERFEKKRVLSADTIP